MGVLWSRLAPAEDYERILSDLLTRISELEVHLAETRHQHRRLALWILLYGALLYLLAILYVFLYPRGPARVPYRPLLDGMVLVLGPLLLYYGRRLLGWIYGRRIASLETRLRHLRAKQKLKVEELKKATAYYRTKGLIERFDINDASSHGRAMSRSPARSSTASAPSPAPPLATDASVLPPSFPRRPSTASPLLHVQAPPPSQLSARPLGLAPSASLMAPPPPPPASLSMTPPTWLDRLVDAIIGDDRNSRYALICPKCYAHNGLAPPEEFASIRTFWLVARQNDLSFVEYICPNCHHLNLPRISSKPNLLESPDLSGPPSDISLDDVVPEKSHGHGHGHGYGHADAHGNAHAQDHVHSHVPAAAPVPAHTPEAPLPASSSSSSTQETPKQPTKRAAVVRRRPQRRNSNPEKLAATDNHSSSLTKAELSQ